MKIEKSKHAHNLTKLLKVCLFAFVMILPILAVMSTTLYTMFNKNAKDSYYGETINQTQITETNKINANSKYTITFDANNTYNTNSDYIEVDMLETYSNKSDLNTLLNNVREDIKYFAINMSGANITLTTYDSEMVENFSRYLIEDRVITFKFYSYTNSVYTWENLTQTTYNKYSYLSESFYYATDTLWERPLFNWATTGVGHTALSGFTNVFGIQSNSFITNILVYWSTITMIYIVFDIVIELFVALTHLIGKKAD